MKLRIKGNSIRLRLTKSEVQLLSETGHVEEQTDFGSVKLTYAIHASSTDNLSATFENNAIIVYIPEATSRNWFSNNVISHKGNYNNLSLLVEKDFVCIDATEEDQSDNYENPNKVC